MAFNNYLEDENDKPYFTTNSLAYYYDKMEGFAKAVEGSAKALNLTKEEIEQRIALRLAEWDKNLESFDGSVEKLLTEWVDDGTLTHVIDSTLIDQRIAPVTAQLADIVTVNLTVTNELDITNDLKNALVKLQVNGGGLLNIPFRKENYLIKTGNIEIPSNVFIKGNGSTFKVEASETTRFLFNIDSASNVTIDGLNIKSDDLYVRVNGRANLGSNVIAFNVLRSTKIMLSNIYVESLEAGLWVNFKGYSYDVNIRRMKSFKTKQPIFIKYLIGGKFTELDLDCLNSVGHDHQIYLNGGTDNLFFANLNFINGYGPAISTKIDTVGEPINKNIYFSNVNIQQTCGFFLSECDNVSLTNITVSDGGRNDIFPTYGIRFEGKNFLMSNFTVNGFNVSLSLPNCENVKISNGICINMKLYGLDTLNSKEINIESVSFTANNENVQFYFSQYDYNNQVVFNNCVFICTVKLLKNPISIRALKEKTVIQNCLFSNRGSDNMTGVMYNLSPSKVLTMNNRFDGFTNFKATLDTATIDTNSTQF